MKTKSILPFILILLAITLSGCGKKAEPPPPPPKEIKLLADAEAFAQANPEQYSKAIKYYKTVIKAAPDSPQATEAKQRINELSDKLHAAEDAAWALLLEESNRRLKAGLPDKAIKHLKEYTGSYATALKKRRNEQIEYITSLESEKQAKQAKALRNAQNAFFELQTTVAEALYHYQFKAAQEELSSARRKPVYSPVQNQLNTFVEQAEQVARMPETICASYLDTQNQEIPVRLTSGTKKLLILGVNGEDITAERVIRVNGEEAGSTPSNFSFSDLSIKEQFVRLGKEKTDSRQIMRSLILVRAKQYDKALQYLNNIDTPLTSLLKDKLDERLDATKKPLVPTHPVFEPDDENVLIVL